MVLVSKIFLTRISVKHVPYRNWKQRANISESNPGNRRTGIPEGTWFFEAPFYLFTTTLVEERLIIS